MHIPCRTISSRKNWKQLLLGVDKLNVRYQWKWLSGKSLSANAGDAVLTADLGRSPAVGNGNSL